MSKKIIYLMAVLMLGFTLSSAALAEPPKTENGVTTIHLDEYNGYFAARETLASLKPGTYEFVITNKADKTVGWLIQNGRTHERLDMFPLQPGQTRTSRVEITSDGFRYRCPINPTPWYDVSVSE